MRDIELRGIFIQSFVLACKNLNVLASESVAEILAARADSWVPAERFTTLFHSLEARFRDFEPIKERLGMEMMRLWYDLGPGRSIVSTGVDFLRFQTGSEGYLSVVRGPAATVGAFTLDHLDVSAGRARVKSTTPFDHTMERGVLLGGMRLAGDLVYVDARNEPVDVRSEENPSVYELTFH
jgi:hypothetical protein